MFSTVYNAENQWIQQTHFGINYMYDGVGRRVEATGGSSGTRVYWYDESGNVVSESDQNGVFQNDYIYFNGQKITWVDLGHGQPTTNNYYLADHLGNTRMIITQTGTVCYDVDYYPWGAEQQVYKNTCPVQNYKFTGKERDPDLGEDYFGARFYKGDMSRFFSPDWSAGPEPVPYAKLDNPQTLNLYSYVGNNPTTLRDVDGHYFINWGAAAAQAATKIDQQKADAQTKQQDSQAQNAPLSLDAPPPAPGLPENVAAIKYDNGAPALSKEEEEKVSKDVGAPGVLSVNISYTTNGEHSANSLHYSGQAADITKVNGQSVHDYHKNPAEKSAVDSVVARANKNGAHEVFAPGRQTFKDGTVFRARTEAAQRALESQHENHIHIAEQ